MQKFSMTILIPRELHRNFKFAALKEDKPMTHIIIEMMKDFIKEKEKENESNN